MDTGKDKSSPGVWVLGGTGKDGGGGEGGVVARAVKVKSVRLSSSQIPPLSDRVDSHPYEKCVAALKSPSLCMSVAIASSTMDRRQVALRLMIRFNLR